MHDLRYCTLYHRSHTTRSDPNTPMPPARPLSRFMSRGGATAEDGRTRARAKLYYSTSKKSARTPTRRRTPRESARFRRTCFTRYPLNALVRNTVLSPRPFNPFREHRTLSIVSSLALSVGHTCAFGAASAPPASSCHMCPTSTNYTVADPHASCSGPISFCSISN